MEPAPSIPSGEARRARVAARRGRQHHPLRRIPGVLTPSPGASEIASLGIDAEVNEPLPDGVFDQVRVRA